MSQSVDLDHPRALQFLREDASHVNAFFRRARGRLLNLLSRTVAVLMWHGSDSSPCLTAPTPEMKGPSKSALQQQARPQWRFTGEGFPAHGAAACMDGEPEPPVLARRPAGARAWRR